MHHAGNSHADHTGRHRACPTIRPRVNILLKINDHLRYTPQVSKSTTSHRLQHVDMVAINPLTGRGSAARKSIAHVVFQRGARIVRNGVRIRLARLFHVPAAGLG